MMIYFDLTSFLAAPPSTSVVSTLIPNSHQQDCNAIPVLQNPVHQGDTNWKKLAPFVRVELV
jgi:hypothetical protein